jgi:hypothetical protein
MALRITLLVILTLVSAVALDIVSRTVLESLVSPGELSAAHGKLAGGCFACHVPLAKSRQNGACVSCHARVGKDVEAGTGFHGRIASARSVACKSCHAEHRGGAFALIAFDPRKFDHRQADFALHGAHVRTACSGCHALGKPFANAPSACVACHVKVDIHRGRFGRSCAACHSEDNWKAVHAFDHARTGYALIGLHVRAPCAGCHVANHFAGTPRTCIACHRADDKHQGSRGTDCGSCHSPIGWKYASFRHDRDTRFALVGAHRTVTCTACHGLTMERRQPPTTCTGCHAARDPHKGRFGNACASCHGVDNWQTQRFDHDRLTRFALQGGHRGLACAACHKGPLLTAMPPLACADCHAAKDPHRGKLGRDCASCHAVAGWKIDVRFDHSRTRFALVGRHATVACKDCHADKTFAAKGVACAACHADKHHDGTFGKTPDCAGCHIASDWSRWHFDHGRRTRFALDGAHERIACKACHARPAPSAKLPSACIACHRADDIHHGAFGASCGDCHSAASFATPKLPGRMDARKPSTSGDGR